VTLSFEWDEGKSKRNLEKHGVPFEEAKTASNDPLAITLADPDHSREEDRYLDIGLSSRGRVIVVWYTERLENIRIIGCRRATPLKGKLMKRGKKELDDGEMRKEYDFSGGVRGKYYKAYRQGHTVRIGREDGSTSVQYFTQEDGAIMLDPDVKPYFPDSESVNKALRSLITQERVIPRHTGLPYCYDRKIHCCSGIQIMIKTGPMFVNSTLHRAQGSLAGCRLRYSDLIPHHLKDRSAKVDLSQVGQG
jgi:uncharacterized DUF497 family protein